MANFNRVLLVGNLTRDPELTHTPSNTAVCKFGIAVNRQWNDRQSNERREETMFIDCVAWAKQGEVINQYCSKGQPILIEGRLHLDTWTNPEGQKRSKHSVVVENFQFLGGRGGGGARKPAGERTAEVSHQGGGSDDVPF